MSMSLPSAPTTPRARAPADGSPRGRAGATPLREERTPRSASRARPRRSAASAALARLAQDRDDEEEEAAEEEESDYNGEEDYAGVKARTRRPKRAKKETPVKDDEEEEEEEEEEEAEPVLCGMLDAGIDGKRLHDAICESLKAHRATFRATSVSYEAFRPYPELSWVLDDYPDKPVHSRKFKAWEKKAKEARAEIKRREQRNKYELRVRSALGAFEGATALLRAAAAFARLLDQIRDIPVEIKDGRVEIRHGLVAALCFFTRKLPARLAGRAATREQIQHLEALFDGLLCKEKGGGEWDGCDSCEFAVRDGAGKTWLVEKSDGLAWFEMRE
jgi:hypothetical protein